MEKYEAKETWPIIMTKKKFSIICHWGNENQNSNEIPLYTYLNGYNKKDRQ